MCKQKAIEDQEKAIKEIASYLLDKNRTKYGLFGRAGTGKTHVVIKAVIDLYYDRYNMSRVFNIAFISTSNKAVGVLENQLKQQYSINSSVLKFVNFLTITKFLNKSATYDEKGNTVFVKNTKNKTYQDYHLIVVDEASMLDANTLKELYSYTKSYHRKPKFLFIADKYQCPPPSGEGLSEIFGYDHYELTKPYRYDAQIGSVVDFVRSCVDNPISIGDFRSKLKKMVNNKFEIYTSKRKFLDGIIDSFNCDKNIIATCYRNKTTKGLSDCIRDRVVDFPEEQFNVGDVLLCTFSNSKLKTTVINSELYKIKSIEESTISVFKGSYHHSKLEIEIDCDNYEMYNKPKLYCAAISCYFLELESNGVTHNAWVLADEGQKYYDKALEESKQLMKKHKYTKEHLAREYYQLSNLFTTFMSGFAINIYKSQGSTYDEVFVNMKDIFSVRPITLENKYRALYTAMTRARNKVHVLDEK